MITQKRWQMRRYYIVMVLAILIQACAGLPINGLYLSTKAPVSTPTVASTFTPMNTSTPTATRTVVPSLTVVHIPTQDPDQPTATILPLPFFIGKGTITPAYTPTPLGPGPGFKSVFVGEKVIFWGSCKPNTVRIVAKVENPEDVFSVVIFVRVKSAFKEDYTPWTSGDVMNNRRDGSFSYTLSANTTRGHNHYKKSWILFQLVATDDFGKEVGRSKIYTNEISLSPCQ
jgi:hypothetical protein